MRTKDQTRSRRVILVHWKKNIHSSFEVFSNLRLFCQTHTAYNYNTINNYLSKGKTAFENDEIRLERKKIIDKSSLVSGKQVPSLKMEKSIKKFSMLHEHSLNESDEYWKMKTPEERLGALYFIVSQSIKPGQRMDKTVIRKLDMHGAG